MATGNSLGVGMKVDGKRRYGPQWVPGTKLCERPVLQVARTRLLADQGRLRTAHHEELVAQNR